MLIAHLPAGYILGTTLARQWSRHLLADKVVVLCALAGALAPDLDMLYFYLVDGRSTHHHKYLTHWPIIWIAWLGCSLLWHALKPRQKLAAGAVVFGWSGLLHLLLDSFVGDLWLLAPWVDRSFAMFTVPARFDIWWLNFILHWSFAVELFIVCWAVWIFVKQRRETRRTTGVGI